MGAYDVPIIKGKPGTTWVNDTGLAVYQYICELKNTCGACLQYHLLIGSWWPIPLHKNCRCKQWLLLPGDTSKPFVDFLELLDGFTKEQKIEAIGLSNWKLLQAGLISWSDVVSEASVASLKEVVWKTGLTIKDMIDAGVAPYIAEAAYAAAYAGEASTDAKKLQELIDALKGAGMSDEDIKKLLKEGIKQKSFGGGVPVLINPGPSSLSISTLDVPSFLGG